MAFFAATLGVMMLSGSVNLSASNKDACDLYAAVGQNLPLSFVYEGLANTHVLKWTHNNTIIFYRKQGKVFVGKTEDISATGSLLLKNLQFLSAGAYEAHVMHPNGTVAKTWSGRLCIMDKVPKPQVSYVCDFKSIAVNLNCKVAERKGLVFSWTLDEKTLTSETRQSLSISLAQLKGERSFTCSVADRASKERSDAVRPTCKPPSPSAPPLLCFTSKTVVAAAAGGASLILILLVIIVKLCCCRRCNKTQRRLGEKGDMPMLSMSKREPDSISPDYETMHPPEDSPPPSPQPSARARDQNLSKPEARMGSSSLQPSTAAEGRQPSPVPKPRTKSPQTSNI